MDEAEDETSANYYSYTHKILLLFYSILLQYRRKLNKLYIHDAGGVPGGMAYMMLMVCVCVCWQGALSSSYGCATDVLF